MSTLTKVRLVSFENICIRIVCFDESTVPMTKVPSACNRESVWKNIYFGQKDCQLCQSQRSRLPSSWCTITVDRQLHPLDQSADFKFANQINKLFRRRHPRYSKCNHVNLEFNQIKKNMPKIVHRVLFSHRFELWLHRLWQNHFLLTRCSIQHLPNILFLLILLFFKRFINWNSSLKL